MRSSELIRLCGLAAMLAGSLLVFSDLMDLAVRPTVDSGGFGGTVFEDRDPSALLVVQSAVTLFAGVPLLFGLVGLYASRVDYVGLLGMFGFIVAFSGTVMAVGGFWTNVFLSPSLVQALATEAEGIVDLTPPRALASGFALSYGLVALGWFMFGLAIVRNRAYPLAPAALLTFGAPLVWLPFPLTGMPFSVAVAWLGYALYSDRTGRHRDPHP